MHASTTACYYINHHRYETHLLNFKDSLVAAVNQYQYKTWTSTKLIYHAKRLGFWSHKMDKQWGIIFSSSLLSDMTLRANWCWSESGSEKFVLS